MRWGLAAALLAVTAAPAVRAQTPETHSREVQLRMLEHQRKMLLAMADSMPEKWYREKATPSQRDFAQQLHHAAGAVAFIASGTMGGGRPTLPDTATAFGSRAGLTRFINAAFDHAGGLFKGQTDAARREQADLFGQKMPRWQVWDEIHTHTVWTAGQVVANFRLHGMAPPAFTFF